jgi:AcrR family transcriptional regulator
MTFEPLTADRRRQQTREYLLQAAGQVFAERGFYGATLDEVAARAGFTKGAVYSNFKNKDDLFLALLEAGYHREQAALHETLAGSDVPPEERLGDFVALIDNELGMVPENWGVLYLEFTLYAMRNPAAKERLLQLEEEDVRAIAAIIEGEQARFGTEPSVSAMHQARIVTALFRGIAMMRELDAGTVGPDLMTDALAFVSRGLGANPELA